GCLTRAVRIRLREAHSLADGRMLVIVPSDIVESAMRRSCSTTACDRLTLLASRTQPDSAEKRCHFRTSSEKFFALSGSIIERYGAAVILECLARLQSEADLQGGLDHV